MTPEEAINFLSMIHKNLSLPDYKEALGMALNALYAKQEPVKLDRSRLPGCTLCKGVTGWTQDLDDEHHEVEFLFCPVCGRPITEEAGAELERRINGG